MSAHLVVRIPGPLADLVRDVSADEGISAEQVVRDATMAYLADRKERERQRQEQKRLEGFEGWGQRGRR
jgi:hypothetical protein